MLNVLKSGFFTTIQDNGRFGYLNKGVPVSGVMDPYTTSKLNAILGNDPNDAVMEITMTGPTMKFQEPTFICFGGANIVVNLNDKPLKHFKIHKIEIGDVLSYGRLENGFRNYLAIKGGFKTKEVLKSRSFFMPITNKNCLADNDEIPYKPTKEYKPVNFKEQIDIFLDAQILDVAKGPEFNILNDKQLQQLFGSDFSIAKEYNRMAYQIEQKIQGHSYTMLTSATLPGTIQLTPSGKVIVLMKDGQTTGGYPRILQLSDRAISVLAQKKYKDTISFNLLQ